MRNITLVLTIAIAGFAFGLPSLAAPVAVKARTYTASPSAKEGFSTDRLQRLDAWTAKQVAKDHFVGASVTISRHGKPVHFGAFGVQDRTSKAPITGNTLFRIYSQTKPIIGVAMMTLYEEGKWRLDDPITKFIPEFKDLKVLSGMDEKGQPITVATTRVATMRDLMTHMAGFGYGLSPDDPVGGLYRASGLLGAESSQAFIDTLAKLPLANQPGERWRYSVAVDVQGVVIERISGQTLANFLNARIFAPLRMNDTAFFVAPEKISRLAGLYYFDPRTGASLDAVGPQVQDFTKPRGFSSGGGGLVSTSHDYGRFAQMILNKGALDGARILAPGTVALMSANHLPAGFGIGNDGTAAASSPGIGFGLGFGVVIDPVKAGTLLGEGTLSWGGAAGTWFWIDPKNDLYFLGMIQSFLRPEGLNIADTTRALTYGALVTP